MARLPSSSLSLLATLLLLSTVRYGFAAASACVQFDVPDLVACTDISSDEFLASNPNERLIEARIPISSLVRLGSEDSLLQFLYILESPQQTFRVVDYSPKTVMESDIVGHVAVEQTRGKNANLGLKANSAFGDSLHAEASAANGSTKSDAVRFERLPPLRLLSASGTMRRGTGAYFKLKPSTQFALEGARDFTIVARVPGSWRGDLLRVHCAAYGGDEGRGNRDGEPICGTTAFSVGLYLAGDEPARQIASRLVREETRLKQLAQSQHGEIEDRKFPSLGHKLGAIFSLVDPKIPDHWLEMVIGLSPASNKDFSRYLPDEVRTALTSYQEARRQIASLAGR